MPGDVDPLYIAARQILLDALEALNDHRDSIVLVGAQAVYVHTGDADISVAPFTTDADLAIDPRRLAADPRLEIALAEAGFIRVHDVIGAWQKTAAIGGVPTPISLDLLVPSSLGGAGRRAARIPPHDRNSVRKATGLEAVLVDRENVLLASLDPDGARKYSVAVAGPAALIVAKMHKISDRVDDTDRDRANDKDALDIYRLLVGVATENLVARFGRLLESELSRAVTESAISDFSRLFGSRNGRGTEMTMRAASPLGGDGILEASVVTLANDLLNALPLRKTAPF